MIYSVFLSLFLIFLTQITYAFASIEGLFSSTPEQMITLTEKEDFLIGGIIHPLSGQPSIRQTDLIAIGAESILLKCIFIPQYKPLNEKNGQVHPSKNAYAGWVHFPHTHLTVFTEGKNKSGKNVIKEQQVCVVDPNGAVLVYSIEEGITKLKTGLNGICNGCHDHPSGQLDPRNVSIKVEDPIVTVVAPDGTKRIYRRTNLYRLNVEKKNYTCLYCLLQKEILPNGMVLKYAYHPDRQLKKISSLDPNERNVYASISFEASPFIEQGTCLTHTGKKAGYQHNTSQFFKPKYQKTCVDLLYPLRLTKVSSPFFRGEEIAYSNMQKEDSLLESFIGEHQTFKCKYLNEQNKVQTLLIPHDTKKFQNLCTMQYRQYNPFSRQVVEPLVKDSVTEVSHFDGTKTIYKYYTNMLPKEVQSIDQNGAVIKLKRFAWTDNHWLKSITVLDGKDQILSQKTFEYDSFGNPIKEILIGDLTGQEQIERDVVLRKFSSDGRNLLLEEEFSNGKVVAYTYLPGTNLVTSCLTKVKGGACLTREFREYNDCNQLILKLQDDGLSEKKEDSTGVLQKRITRYTLRQNAPFMHMPEWVIETYLEKGVEVLLRKKQLHYDIHGNIAKELIFDKAGQLAYTIDKEYNERGDIISETNPLGQKAIYAYDNHGRMIHSTNFSQSICEEITYDPKGRPSSIKEIPRDGNAHISFNKYDLKDRLVQKIDHFGQSTHYSYHLICDKPLTIEESPIAAIDGTINRVTTKASYDALGRKTAETDPNGNRKTFRYNAYGSITEICYPDNGIESFIYTTQGLLKRHKSPDGLSTHYEYDTLGNIISKTYYFNEESLAKESFKYKGSLLLETKDKEENVTQYSYDGSGRKIRQERCGRVSSYSYNSLGYLQTMCEENGEQSLYTDYQRDVLGRMLKKTCKDVQGNILAATSYTYDPDGNVHTVSQTVNGNEVSDTYTYDSYGREISHQDRCGFITTTHYDEKATNEIGQTVLKKTVTDPKMVSKEVLFDSFNRVAQEQTFNQDGAIVAAFKRYYDPCGSLLWHQEDVYYGTQLVDTKTTGYTYDPCNRVKSSTRAYGTRDARTITYSYTPAGKLSTKMLPNGTRLQYKYNPFGYMSSLSSDKKLHHTFRYNRLGELLSAIDQLKDQEIKRTLDAEGNVLVEQFPGELSIKKSYDAFNRPLEVTFPDNSKVAYTYDPIHCKSVTRKNACNESIYSHTYDAFDTSGHLKQESLINSLGTITYEIDPNGRMSSLSSPYLNQRCTFDEVGNVTEQSINSKAVKFSYDPLSQITSEEGSTFSFDSTFNRISHNGSVSPHNHLDEVMSKQNAKCQYDLNGNLIRKSTPEFTQVFRYDPLDRLIEVESDGKRICYTYDPLGRKIGKDILSLEGEEILERERYLFDGQNDVGTVSSDGKINALRILGISHPKAPRTVAMELQGNLFVPLLDAQGNVRSLVTPSKDVVSYSYSAFGEQSTPPIDVPNPWQYASKRFDKDTCLVDFGKRHYDPFLSRWTTTDPAGFIDSYNLYQFNFNNPLRYTDLDGQIAIAIPLFTMAFDFTVSWITTEVLVGSVIGGALIAYEVTTAKRDAEHRQLSAYNEAVAEENIKEKKKKREKPPYDGQELGSDPTKCPGEGFEWKGNGAPGTGKGSWSKGKGECKESLYPDLKHPDPIGPHWDYKSSQGEWRLKLDGTWESK